MFSGWQYHSQWGLDSKNSWISCCSHSRYPQSSLVSSEFESVSLVQKVVHLFGWRLFITLRSRAKLTHSFWGLGLLRNRIKCHFKGRNGFFPSPFLLCMHPTVISKLSLIQKLLPQCMWMAMIIYLMVTDILACVDDKGHVDLVSWNCGNPSQQMN